MTPYRVAGANDGEDALAREIAAWQAEAAARAQLARRAQRAAWLPLIALVVVGALLNFGAVPLRALSVRSLAVADRGVAKLTAGGLRMDAVGVVPTHPHVVLREADGDARLELRLPSRTAGLSFDTDGKEGGLRMRLDEERSLGASFDVRQLEVTDAHFNTLRLTLDAGPRLDVRGVTELTADKRPKLVIQIHQEKGGEPRGDVEVDPGGVSLSQKREELLSVDSGEVLFRGTDMIHTVDVEGSRVFSRTDHSRSRELLALPPKI